MIDLETKKIINDSVTSVTPASSIILFGSYAKGLQTEDSDIDLCVITDEEENVFEIMSKIRLSLYGKIKKAFDILVYRSIDFSKRSIKNKSFESEINNTGVKIYG